MISLIPQWLLHSRPAIAYEHKLESVIPLRLKAGRRRWSRIPPWALQNQPKTLVQCGSRPGSPVLSAHSPSVFRTASPSLRSIMAAGLMERPMGRGQATLPRRRLSGFIPFRIKRLQARFSIAGFSITRCTSHSTPESPFLQGTGTPGERKWWSPPFAEGYDLPAGRTLPRGGLPPRRTHRVSTNPPPDWE